MAFLWFLGHMGHGKDRALVSRNRCHSIIFLRQLRESYDDYVGIALNPKERIRLVADLGDASFMILQGSSDSLNVSTYK